MGGGSLRKFLTLQTEKYILSYCTHLTFSHMENFKDLFTYSFTNYRHVQVHIYYMSVESFILLVIISEKYEVKDVFD